MTEQQIFKFERAMTVITFLLLGLSMFAMIGVPVVFSARPVRGLGPFVVTFIAMSTLPIAILCGMLRNLPVILADAFPEIFPLTAVSVASRRKSFSDFRQKVEEIVGEIPELYRKKYEHRTDDFIPVYKPFKHPVRKLYWIAVVFTVSEMVCAFLSAVTYSL